MRIKFDIDIQESVGYTVQNQIGLNETVERRLRLRESFEDGHELLI